MLLRKNQKISQIKNRKLTTVATPKSPVAEQYRTIRSNIQFAAVEGELRSLMVTSSEPAEGKSTTIANLAVVMAQQGKKVLLVDADLRKPTVHYTFQVANTVGLTNVLLKQTELLSTTQETDVENLHVLASGPIPPNPAELLGSRSMNALIEEATTHFDVVLFDTPPVLAVTDAQILANQLDGVVLVVKSGKTERDNAIKAKELLTHAKAKVLGVVLNQKEVKQSQYYYYYGEK